MVISDVLEKRLSDPALSRSDLSFTALLALEAHLPETSEEVHHSVFIVAYHKYIRPYLKTSATTS